MKFPKRFEMEGIDPMQCPVVVIGTGTTCVYLNMEKFLFSWNPDELCGPMADMHNGKRCVRFETVEANKQLSV